MSITVQKKNFYLKTKNSMYQIMADQYGVLRHVWYGERTDFDMEYLHQSGAPAFCPNLSDAGEDTEYSLDILPLEYSCDGIGDYRAAAAAVTFADGSRALDLRYESYRIYDGKYEICGLPASYANADEAQTLEITLKDTRCDLRVILRYGVFEDTDIITRQATFQNGSDENVVLENAASLCLDLPEGDWEWIHFHGRHLTERNSERAAIIHGIQEISSKRGVSSHTQNPSFVICSADCTETAGSCYGAAFVYSGNFRASIECSQMHTIRAVMGIHPDLFSWKLAPSEEFNAPEVLLSYSGEGFGKLSQSFHKIIRENVCRGKYKLCERPVLINTWEAIHFDFDREKVLDIAKEAARLGVDMLVLDDGWFGNRNDDKTGLGDWFANEDKLEGGLPALADGISQLGMKFGIWVEPEMVSEDSCLYRSHPEWVIKIPGRNPSRCRNQLVLDMANPDVVDYLFESLSKLLSDADISYVKWDMNRSICDWYSPVYPADRQGEVPHRFVLGLYSLLERLTQKFPDVLFEGCSSGGGRFDAGMLYYTPQIWTSDNSDAFERTRIQYGTSFFYPVSTMGAHISEVPNHQTGRITPIEARSTVAMHGSFGYELDLNKLSDEEKELVRQQIKQFKEFGPLIHGGKYFRLSNPLCENFAAWAFVAENMREALVQAVKFNNIRNDAMLVVKPRGLDPDLMYRIDGDERVFSGKALMQGGYPLEKKNFEYAAYTLHIVAAK